MQQFIRFYFLQMMTKFWIGFLILIGLICLAQRQAYEGNLNVFVLKMLTNHYLMIFLVMPIFLQCISKVYREPQMVELIRVRKFYRIVLAKWLAVCCFSIVFVLSMGLVESLLSIGLDGSSTWDGSIDVYLKTYLTDTFRSPLEAIFLTAGFMVLGLSFIGCTYVTVAHYFSRKGAYGFVIATYLFMIIAFKTPWLDLLREFSMSRYLILHHNFTGDFTWQGTIIVVMVGIFVQFIAIKKWRYVGDFTRGRQRVHGKGLLRYYGRILFAQNSMTIWVVGLLVLVTMKASGREETLQDFIVRFFYGYRNGEIHLFTWLEQLIYIGIPVYLFAVFMQGWLVKRDWQMYIRLLHKRRWVQVMLSLIGVFAASYVLLTCLLLVGAAVLFNKAFVVDGTQLAYLLCMKMLEIGALLGLLFLLFVLTNKVTLSFICTMGLYVLNYLPYTWTSYNVAGIGQLARVNEINQSMLTMGASGFTYVVIFLLLIGCSYKKYFTGR